MTRTDIHRPAVFLPENYEYFGAGDNGSRTERPYNCDLRPLRAMGYEADPNASNSKCSHCGAGIRYYAVLTHEPTKTYIYAGETCLNNRFDLANDEFQTLRKAAQLNRERTAKATKIDNFFEKYSDLAWVSYPALTDGNDFLSSVAFKLRQYGELSERQIASLRKSYDDTTAYLNRQAAREAEKAAKIASGDVHKAPTGRITVQGVIRTLKTQETYFGHTTQYILKARVETTAGWNLWVTVPSALDNPTEGQDIKITVTVEPSGNDPYFAFGKRPVLVK